MSCNAGFCYFTSIEKFIRFLLSGLLKFILAEQDMELAERSTDLNRKKSFGEIIKELVCVLVDGLLMAVEGSLQVILSVEYHWTLKCRAFSFYYPLCSKKSAVQQSGETARLKHY